MGGSFFFKGIVVGFSIAAPVGPIGVLCIRRTLAESRAHGLASGLGAATADAIYGSISAFGVTLLSGVLGSQQAWLRLCGGVFLCYLGVRSFLERPVQRAAEANGKSLLGAYATTFFLTLTNPLTIFSFMAVFAGLGVTTGRANRGAAGMLVLGVFIGSSLWWLLLSGVVGRFRSRVQQEELKWVNRISGAIITGFGLLALISLMNLKR